MMTYRVHVDIGAATMNKGEYGKMFLNHAFVKR